LKGPSAAATFALALLALGAGCPGPVRDVAGLALDPPLPGAGVQIRIGPFDVPRGAEIQRNFYSKLESDQEVDVNRVEIVMRDGSHHLNLFKTGKEDQLDHYEDDFTQLDFERYDLFAGSQSRTLDWRMPPGVGIRFAKRQQLVVQSHYVNASTQQTPGRAEALINLWFARPGEVKHRMGTLFANNRRLNLPPGCGVDSPCSFSQWFVWKRDVFVAAMTGHFHSRGKRFVVAGWDGARETGMVYESQNWEDPPFRVFEGAGVPIAKDTGIRFTAEYVNRSPETITFGPRVETNEHANLFLYFYPCLPEKDLIYTTTDATEETAGSQE
jgi:hypothetical protein